jgi:hypothetical protein
MITQSAEQKKVKEFDSETAALDEWIGEGTRTKI